jgi:hypothetical protein
MDEIVSHLATAYPDVTPEQARKDAEQFIQSLVPGFVIPSPDEH